MHKLGTVHSLQLANSRVHGSRVADRLHHVARASLALGTDHRRTFGDAASGLTEIATSTHERNLEIVLVDVVLLISRSQHL